MRLEDFNRKYGAKLTVTLIKNMIKWRVISQGFNDIEVKFSIQKYFTTRTIVKAKKKQFKHIQRLVRSYNVTNKALEEELKNLPKEVVYYFRTKDGKIKIGRSGKPEQRLNEVNRQMLRADKKAKHRFKLTTLTPLMPSATAKELEEALLVILNRIGKPYYPNVSFDAASEVFHYNKFIDKLILKTLRAKGKS